jgi:hypothetical protein
MAYGWLQLLEKTRYNNHYYLELVLAAAFVLTDAHAAWSLGRRCRPRASGRGRGGGSVPAWQLWCFRGPVRST